MTDGSEVPPIVTVLVMKRHRIRAGNSPPVTPASENCRRCIRSPQVRRALTVALKREAKGLADHVSQPSMRGIGPVAAVPV